VVLEKRLRTTLRRQRDTEVRLQLEVQKKSKVEGTASELMRENDSLKKEIEDIRARLLESKLQNVRLKTELQGRREALENSFAARLGRWVNGCVEWWKTCRGSGEGRREGKEVLAVVVLLMLVFGGMLVFFYIVVL